MRNERSSQISDATREALERPWALTLDGFEGVSAALESARPVRRLLEYGSGASTIALLEQFPDLHIVTIDHDVRYVPTVPAALASRVEQVIAPLVWRTIDGVLCRTYRYEPSGVFDAALVDGPPGTNPNGRLGAMLVAYRHLREGGVMVLDDAHRPTELRWVGNFVRLTGATLRYQGNGHGLATFRRFELKHGRRGVIEANASMFLEQGILAISRRLRR